MNRWFFFLFSPFVFLTRQWKPLGLNDDTPNHKLRLYVMIPSSSSLFSWTLRRVVNLYAIIVFPYRLFMYSRNLPCFPPEHESKQVVDAKSQIRIWVLPLVSSTPNVDTAGFDYIMKGLFILLWFFTLNHFALWWMPCQSIISCMLKVTSP